MTVELVLASLVVVTWFVVGHTLSRARRAERRLSSVTITCTIRNSPDAGTATLFGPVTLGALASLMRWQPDGRLAVFSSPGSDDGLPLATGGLVDVIIETKPDG